MKYTITVNDKPYEVETGDLGASPVRVISPVHVALPSRSAPNVPALSGKPLPEIVSGWVNVPPVA